MKQGFALAGTCFLLSIAGFLAHVWFSVDRLPPRVATHFTMKGAPDGWMKRGNHLRYMTAAGIGVPLLVVGAFFLVRKIPARFVNVPYRDYWMAEERKSSTTSWLTRSGLWLGCVLTLGMGVLHELVVRANQSTPVRLEAGPVFLVVAILMVCAVGFVIATVLRFDRPPKSGS